MRICDPKFSEEEARETSNLLKDMLELRGQKLSSKVNKIWSADSTPAKEPEKPPP